MSKIKNMG